jgi:uncharacterized membrane protein
MGSDDAAGRQRGEALLHGLPGHPLHPPLTDATIGMFVLATGLAILGAVGAIEAAAAKGCWLALIGGLAMALPTAATGFADWLRLQWGSPPWRSRVLRRALRYRASPLVAVLLIVSVAAVVIAFVATATRDHALAVACAWASVALGEAATAMAAMGVRQWRFAPRSRAVSLASLLAVCVLLVAPVPALLTGRSVWGVILLVVLLTVVAIVARHPAARARAVVRERCERVRP